MSRQSEFLQKKEKKWPAGRRNRRRPRQGSPWNLQGAVFFSLVLLSLPRAWQENGGGEEVTRATRGEVTSRGAQSGVSRSWTNLNISSAQGRLVNLSAVYKFMARRVWMFYLVAFASCAHSVWVRKRGRVYKVLHE